MPRLKYYNNETNQWEYVDSTTGNIIDLTNYATKEYVDNLSASDVGALPDTTSIPSALADLTDDATHRVVTDVEKSTWNAKAEVSAIPTKVSELTNDSGFATETYVQEYAQPKGDYALVSEIPSVDGLASEEYVDEQVNTFLNSYYTKDEIDDYELITIDDIDTICGSEAFSYDEAGNVSILSVFNDSVVTYDDDGNVVIS